MRYCDREIFAVKSFFWFSLNRPANSSYSVVRFEKIFTEIINLNWFGSDIG